uniref:Uncharacterized protein n=1 Tax=Anguilla anguilla TaxID=7936 RepID=A0A0E9W4J1_ANGAN
MIKIFKCILFNSS